MSKVEETEQIQLKIFDLEMQENKKHKNSPIKYDLYSPKENLHSIDIYPPHFPALPNDRARFAFGYSEFVIKNLRKMVYQSLEIYRKQSIQLDCTLYFFSF